MCPVVNFDLGIMQREIDRTLVSRLNPRKASFQGYDFEVDRPSNVSCIHGSDRRVTERWDILYRGT